MSTLEAAVFGPVDYSVFIFMICISLAIGIYFGFFGKRSTSAEHYISGLQDIKLTPIAISLIASAISANVLLSFPSEVYSYGAMVIYFIPGSIITILLVAYVYIPIYYNTGVLNAYEYLDRRFDWKVHKMISIFYVIYTYSYTAIVQYMPCLAFAQVTGINVHLVNAVLGSICIIYTMIGGIKAVIWTDVVQAAIMYIFSIVVIVYGVINVGGMGIVFKRAAEGRRLDIFDFDPDITKRNSFWLMMMSCLVANVGHMAFNQTCVQRLIALKSQVHARRVIFLYNIGFVLIICLTVFTGIVIYATYYTCDPIQAKIISKGDKIMPYFVMNTIGHWTGMLGLFISAMFSASYSTVSAQMNSLAGIVYQDYFRKWRLFEHSDFRAKLFMKLVVLVTGIYFILAGFIIDNFGHILQISVIITGATMGLTTGVFTLGMLTPWANKHGAFYGTIISGGITIWVLLGNQFALKNGSLSYPPLPTSIENCEFMRDNVTLAVNTTVNIIYSTTTTNTNEPFILYRLSFYFYSTFSLVLVWIFGLLISFITGYTRPRDLDRSVLATCMHWLLPKENYDLTSNKKEDMELQIPLNK